MKWWVATIVLALVLFGLGYASNDGQDTLPVDTPMERS